MSESRISRSSWRPWAFGALAALSLPFAASCFYKFDNPVEKAPPGSVEGRIALQGALAGQTAAGGQVTVQWTNGLQLSLSTSDAFLFQDLPDGTYTLEVNIPAIEHNDFPLVLIRPDVVLPNVGNATDSLNIGTLDVPASGVVGGTVSPADAGIVVGAFVPGASMDTVGIFEGFSTTTDATGHYSFSLPAGNHALAASTKLNGGVGAATVVSGESQTVNLTLAPEDFQGQINGTLIGSGFGASANTTTVPWDGATWATIVDGTLYDGGLFANGMAPVSTGSGSLFTVNVPAGQLVSLTLIPPPTASPNPCNDFAPFKLPAVPTIAGQATALGQVTWLDNAALGANGIGPCADGGGTVTDGGTDGGGMPMLSGWIDAGVIPWDGGDIAQTVVYPINTSASGVVVAWIAGQVGAYNLYSEILGAAQPTALTILGNVSEGSLSGVELGSGVLLTFSTTSGPTATLGEYIPANGTMPLGVSPQALPNNPDDFNLGYQQTTTFAGSLTGTAGAWVLEAPPDDGGVVGVFTGDGMTFTPGVISLQPGGAGPPILVQTLIGTSCDVANLNGKAGFCLAGSGTITVGSTPTTVGFVSSFDTSGNNPVLTGTVLTTPSDTTAPIYVGLASLPGKVAVAIGSYQAASGVDYWELTDLTVDAGPATPIGVATDVLLDYNDSVLGLSQPGSTGTALEFLPAGAQPEPLADLVNGGNFPAAYVDLNDNVVLAGVPSMGADAYNGMISVLRLVPDGG